MTATYTATIVLSWLALAVLCILVRENSRLDKESRKKYYITYVLIAAAALAEWLGVLLAGNENSPVWLLRAVKCADYILTPMAGVAFVMEVHIRNYWRRLLIALLAVNTLVQIIAALGGWMVRIDAQHNYSHGPLYPAYIALYLLVMVLVGVQFILYGRNFRRQNRTSLYAIIALVLIGIAMQEFSSGGVRIAYIALTFGAALLYIHSAAFTQLATDDVVKQQMIEITVDPLTGLQSRNAYSKMLKKLDRTGMPFDLVVIMIDVNGLKQVNDTMGHEAGDELICGAADCIRRVLGNAYRIGGDEFVYMGSMSRTQANEAMARLHLVTSTWHGKRVGKLSFSAGCALAADHPGLGAEALAREADKEMYAAKARYYRESGVDRRRRGLAKGG
jgi:diguanylate cyclase (GGDEF)-like protein